MGAAEGAASQPQGAAQDVGAAVSPPEAPGNLVPVPPKPKQVANFCRQCGGRMALVVGCLVEHEGRVLLCRRGIEPQQGLWTIPAGFMEEKESSAEGAARETWEEARAKVDILGPFCHFDIPSISQAYILFRARLAAPYTFAAQLPESLDARLFAPHEIPFSELAFSSVAFALRHYLEDLESGSCTIHHGVIVKQPGSGPNTPGSFDLTDHFAIPTSLACK
ncbi:hypothetical protein N2152v2_004961 [Parachlorella kessleri]